VTAPAPGLNPTAASLLGLLHDGPLTGWDLVARAEREIGPFWSLTRSQVYRELARLAEAGLITPGPAGRREARPYTITQAGREAFAAWAARGLGPETMRLPLLLFVTLGRHVPDLAAMLAAQRQQQAATLAGHLSAREVLVAAGADPYRLAVLDYGIAVTRTTIRWLDRLPRQLSVSRPATDPDRDDPNRDDLTTD
jgi:DNA-binding PadR family transcriptional regulator